MGFSRLRRSEGAVRGACEESARARRLDPDGTGTTNPQTGGTVPGMGEIGEPQREIEAPAPVRRPAQDPAPPKTRPVERPSEDPEHQPVGA